jgi:hypothetical protein
MAGGSKHASSTKRPTWFGSSSDSGSSDSDSSDDYSFSSDSAVGDLTPSGVAADGGAAAVSRTVTWTVHDNANRGNTEKSSFSADTNKSQNTMRRHPLVPRDPWDQLHECTQEEEDAALQAFLEDYSSEDD